MPKYMCPVCMGEAELPKGNAGVNCGECLMNRVEMVGMVEVRRPPLKLGAVMVTPAAKDAILEADDRYSAFLVRHQLGDWGELSEHDRTANESALQVGGRVLSSYRTKKGEKVWVLTEADRSATTILLPSDY